MIDAHQFHKLKFPFLKEEDINEIVRISGIQYVEAGSQIFSEGDFYWKVGPVVSGLIRVYSISEDGKDRTFHFFQQGMAFGCDRPIFMNEPSKIYAEAVEDSILIQIDFREFKKLASKNLNIARMYREVLEEGMATMLVRAEDFILYTPEQRYLNLLNQFPDLVDRVTLKNIATYLGITDVSLSRLRKRLQEKGK